MLKCPLLVLNYYNQTWNNLAVFIQRYDIKYYENSLSGSRVVTCIHTDERIDREADKGIEWF